LRLPLLPLLALLALAAATAATAAHADKSRRMTADAVKQKGLTLAKTLDADLDGDGKKELVGICTGPKGVQAVLVGEDADGAVVTFVAPPAGGKEVTKAEVKPLISKTSGQIVLEVFDDTPDEKVKRVRVYGGDAKSLKEIFTARIERAKNADERPEWETDKEIVQYGDPRAGWVFEDLQDDGVMEIAVRRNTGAKIERIPKDGGGEVKLLVGVREQVWTYDAGTGRYAAGPEQLNDFLPAYTIKDVAASSAWVEPKTLKELKSQALSDALSQAAASDAKAPKDAAKDGGAGGSSKAKEKELSDDIKIDLAPFIKPAADGSLSTAWIEGNDKTDGKDEWVEVTLDEEQAIHMVRLVLGCVNSKEDFRAHNVPESFTIQLDNGGQYEVNRRAPGKFEGQILAFSDNLVKLQDRPWAKTTLVFFDGKTEAKKVRVTLDKAIKQGRGNQTCISEISVH